MRDGGIHVIYGGLKVVVEGGVGGSMGSKTRETPIFHSWGV